MGKSKKGKKKSANALKKYWKILGLVRREYAKNKIKVTISELRKDASQIYPLLKELPINKIGRDKVINATKEPPRQKKKLKKEQPYVKSELLEKVEYYVAALQYPLWIEESSSDANFISSISPEGYENIQGGEYADYAFYFKNFTAHCNGLELDNSDDPSMAYVVVIPEYNEQENNWIFRIVSVNIDDEEEDFGFDPTEEIQEVDFVKKEKPEPTEPTQPTEQQSTEKNTPNFVEQAQISEIEKTGKLERLEKKKDGILKEIETYSKIGMVGLPRLNEAFERLDKIIKQIDEID
jgi:hypothetical protein